MVVIVLLVIVVVSVILAWRTLGELEVPVDAYARIKSKKSLKSWGKILFVKGREIFYKSED
jgi:predicted ABC-type sugar transport system permease subunit